MKIKTLISKLSKYDPDTKVEIMVADEVETKKKNASEYVYLFSHKINVRKDTPFWTTEKKSDRCILIFGDISEVLHG